MTALHIVMGMRVGSLLHRYAAPADNDVRKSMIVGFLGLTAGQVLLLLTPVGNAY